MLWSVPKNKSILLCRNYCFPLVYLLVIKFCSVILLLLFAQNRALIFPSNEHTSPCTPAEMIMHNTSDSADQKICLLKNRINILYFFNSLKIAVSKEIMLLTC